MPKAQNYRHSVRFLAVQAKAYSPGGPQARQGEVLGRKECCSWEGRCCCWLYFKSIIDCTQIKAFILIKVDKRPAGALYAKMTVKSLSGS